MSGREGGRGGQPIESDGDCVEVVNKSLNSSSQSLGVAWGGANLGNAGRSEVTMI